MAEIESVEAIDPEALTAARAVKPGDDLLAVITEAFETLADPTRARILYGLLSGPLCVRDLALLAGVSESAVSHQLRMLRDRRLVTARRDGNVIRYAIDNHHVAALFREAEYYADHLLRRLPDHTYRLP